MASSYLLQAAPPVYLTHVHLALRPNPQIPEDPCMIGEQFLWSHRSRGKGARPGAPGALGAQISWAQLIRSPGPGLWLQRNFTWQNWGRLTLSLPYRGWTLQPENLSTILGKQFSLWMCGVRSAWKGLGDPFPPCVIQEKTHQK